jgi:hypothetical protein
MFHTFKIITVWVPDAKFYQTHKWTANFWDQDITVVRSVLDYDFKHRKRVFDFNNDERWW